MNPGLHTLKEAAFAAVTGSIASCRVTDTIIVAGSPRSGTTWLAELLRALPGYKLINEPLRLSTNPEARITGFEWRTCIAPDEERPKARAHLAEVLRGRVELGPAWHFRSENPLRKLTEHVTRRKAVVKFCRAGRMLHWLAARFDVRGIVLIMRHPCATIASMLKMGDNWTERDVTHLPYEKRFGGRIPKAVCDRFRPVFENHSLWVEHLAIKWCLDYYFALYEHAESSYPWTLTSYERLLTRGPSELERIVAALNGIVTEKMRRQFGSPSTFASDSLTENTRQQLSKWKDALTTKQIDAILRVTEAFGMDFYTEALEPDYDRLMQFQRHESKPSLSHAT